MQALKDENLGILNFEAISHLIFGSNQIAITNRGFSNKFERANLELHAPLNFR